VTVTAKLMVGNPASTSSPAADELDGYYLTFARSIADDRSWLWKTLTSSDFRPYRV
jgi:hypothetical protein